MDGASGGGYHGRYMEQTPLPRIALFTTGGTIASMPDPVTGVAPVLSGQELVSAVRGLADLASLEVHQFASVASWNMSPEHMWRLTRTVEDTLASGKYAGAVVTHGTDTVEETSYMLHLGLRADLPVAFAVAMRNAGEVGADGPRNLLDAVRVAVDPTSAGRGALLVVNGEIHSAAHVTKTHTTNICTFRSPGRGPVGWLAHDGVRYHDSPRPHRSMPLSEPDFSVALIKVVTGMGPEPIQWAVDQGARGLVIEGSGAGNIPDTAVPGVRYALERGVLVVLVSRCLEGDVAPVYGTEGGGKSLVAMGVVPGASLNGQKARIRLMMALGSSASTEEARRVFEAGT